WWTCNSWSKCGHSSGAILVRSAGCFRHTSSARRRRSEDGLAELLSARAGFMVVSVRCDSSRRPISLFGDIFNCQQDQPFFAGSLTNLARVHEQSAPPNAGKVMRQFKSLETRHFGKNLFQQGA